MSWATLVLISPLILGLVYFAIVCKVRDLLNLRFLSESLTWPSVVGTITESHIHRGHETDDVVFKYRYSIDGRTYTGTRANFTFRDAGAGYYAAGLPVIVYYRPGHPRTSILEPGGHVSIVGLIWTVFVILFVSYFLGVCLWYAIVPQ